MQNHENGLSWCFQIEYSHVMYQVPSTHSKQFSIKMNENSHQMVMKIHEFMDIKLNFFQP